MSSVMIRQATLKDSEELSRLHSETFTNEPWDAQFFVTKLKSGHHLCLMAEDPELAGFILTSFAADEAEILTIATAIQHRRNGIAMHLLTTCEQNLRQRGVKSWFLDVAEHNQPALALYNRLGFAECGQRRNYYRDGATGIMMAKFL